MPTTPLLPEDQISLPLLFKKRKTDRDIFHELTPFKVKDVLLVATLYDAYSIVREGQFTEKIFGEYLQLNLYSAPRFTSASTEGEALELLRAQRFDMVVLMVGLEKNRSLQLARQIKEASPATPILLLINNNHNLAFFEQKRAELAHFVERVFVWNGDAAVFFAMTKYVEDRMNVDSDTKAGSVQVVLLVEDSVRYYSRYLPILYSTIMSQTQAILSEETNDELHKIFMMRARPKVLLADNFEDAQAIIDRYQDDLLAVISDVEYPRQGRSDHRAGLELIGYVKELNPHISTLLQSSDDDNRVEAAKINAYFLHKESESLALDLRLFMKDKMGFGDFVFKKVPTGKRHVARTVKELEELVAVVPDQSLSYHFRSTGIAKWLMARGEINLAKQIRAAASIEFDSVREMREHCQEIFRKVRFKRMKGKVIPYSPDIMPSRHYVLQISSGSLGGKGRGIAFLCNFIENINFRQILPGIHVAIPATAIIGAVEFDEFLENNGLHERLYVNKELSSIKELFLEGKLSHHLNRRLFHYLETTTRPVAVRSSGLFEDSLVEPFAGVYSTYMVPNNHPDIWVRHKQLSDAIKLVFASIFSQNSQDYFRAVNHKIEEEKMGVIVQEVVGSRHEGYYYPHISGVAQSYNYYPFSYMKPEDGLAVIALGLGRYVVGGERAFRFSPLHPQLEMLSLEDKVRESQKHFYAIDLTRSQPDLTQGDEDATLARLRLNMAEKHGTLKHLASVFDHENNRLTQSFDVKGPRVLDFANILKYEHVPLAKTLRVLLRLLKDALGAPVEIEFALDLNKDPRGEAVFYLLQVKPMIKVESSADLDFGQLPADKLVLMASKGMGNGALEHIRDVVFMDLEVFDKTQTEQMGREVAELNQELEREGREYILVGPGRWGTRDKYTGIPLLWPHIANAKVIVEMGIPDFPLEPSLGSHFFHNVTSMNVGYFCVEHRRADTFVNLDILRLQPVVRQTRFFKHVRFEKPLRVLMDGKRLRFAIVWDS